MILRLAMRCCVPTLCLIVGLVCLAGVSLRTYGDAPADTKSPRARIRTALHAAVDKNLEYCQEWLDSKDFKSLAQTAEGVVVLAGVLESRGEAKRWREATAELAKTARALVAAAGRKDAASCKQRIADLGQENKKLAKLSPGDKPGKPSRPPVALRSTMALLEGTYADAKAALTFGEVENAKNAAYVLSELGRAVSNYRKDATWAKLAGQLSSSALAVAQSDSRDAKAVRQELRGVYMRCEACHDRR